MYLRTPSDLGAVVRDRRKQLGLDQAELAKMVGTSRQWIIGIERGRARAELGLVLRTLEALGLRIDVRPEAAKGSTAPKPDIDIDAIVASARKSKR